jgi:6,7-dimethyl-8-ribityllumazine synthase
MTDKPHVLIIEGRFYTHIADMLLNGATEYLKEQGASYETAEVPGALEIPSVLSAASMSGRFDAYIVLGCIIRGETSHYDIVCNESARGVYAVALSDDLAVGNGILTVENEAQAIVRADPAQKNKGRDAAEAALKVLGYQKQFLNVEAKDAA